MKTIYITDCGTQSVYHLDHQDLKMVKSGGCRDVLHEDNVLLDEDLDNSIIASRVHMAWIVGYEGTNHLGERCVGHAAAQHNDLTVRVV